MVDELDAIRLELGKLGIHFAMFRNLVPSAERKSFDKNLRAYGRVLDRLQRFKNTEKLLERLYSSASDKKRHPPRTGELPNTERGRYYTVRGDPIRFRNNEHKDRILHASRSHHEAARHQRLRRAARAASSDLRLRPQVEA